MTLAEDTDGDLKAVPPVTIEVPRDTLTEAIELLQAAISADESFHYNYVLLGKVYFDDLKYEEISQILDTSVGGLKASFHHAVKKIEKFIITKQQS